MKTYSITEIAQKCNLTASTLRYYEDVGLLPPVERNSSKQRVYTQHHIDRLGAISCFKHTGMSICDIQNFFNYEADEEAHIDDIMTLLTTFQEASLKKLQEEVHAYGHLLRKLDYYNNAKLSYQAHSPHPLWKDYDAKDYMPQVKDALNQM